MDRYQTAFKKFIDAHEKYLDYEDDEEKRLVAIDLYNNQKDINVWYKGGANRYYDKKAKRENCLVQSQFHLKKVTVVEVV